MTIRTTTLTSLNSSSSSGYSRLALTSKGYIRSMPPKVPWSTSGLKTSCETRSRLAMHAPPIRTRSYMIFVISRRFRPQIFSVYSTSTQRRLPLLQVLRLLYHLRHRSRMMWRR